MIYLMQILRPILTAMVNYEKSSLGLINDIINNLHFELYMSVYNYLGPGTKLDKRLARGDKAIIWFGKNTIFVQEL